MSAMATYAIGDIQGCFAALQQLLEHLGFQRQNDRLWLVGDLVNRGPDSLAVLRWAWGMGDRVTAVLGNHDLHLLAVAAGHARLHRNDTLQAVLDAPDRLLLLDWLRTRPLLHAEGAHVLVHAGLLPQWSISDAQRLAAEVAVELAGPRHDRFLAQLYGNQPDFWHEGLTGPDRLRVIVNAMTRMRFCSAEGVMEFATKGTVNAPPPGYLPWFDVPGRRSRETTVVCGHWSALGLRVRPDLCALDSGCLWAGQLTALRLEDRQLFQVPCAGLPGTRPVK